MSYHRDLYIDQYASFSNTFELLDINNAHYPVDTAGYTVDAQLRQQYNSNTDTVFTTNLTTGFITFTLTPNQTGNLTMTPTSRYVYDVILIDPSNTYIRVLEGFAYLNPGVTHS